MKIKMLEELELAPSGLYPPFRKGEIYDAVPASNQPDYERDGLYFVLPRDGVGCELLVSVKTDPVYLLP